MEVVSFELAKKLKEKGFSIPFYFYYRTDDKPLLHHANTTNPLVYCDKVDDEVVIAPTIPQILKWLREEKEIDLVICPIFVYDENKHREYGVEVFAPQLNKPIHCGYFNTWEEAALAGIYAIDKLI